MQEVGKDKALLLYYRSAFIIQFLFFFKKQLYFLCLNSAKSAPICAP